MGRESFLPLFFGDFLASTYTWDGEEQALYLLLLGYQWTAGPLPAEPARLARAVRYDPKRFEKLWTTVSTKFQPCDGGLANPRLEEHRANSIEIGQRKSQAGKAGANARWNGNRNASANGNRIATALPPHENRIDSGNGIHPDHPNHPDIPPPPSGVSPLPGGDAPAGAPPARVNGHDPEVPPRKPKRDRRGPLSHRVPANFEVPDEQAEWAKREFPELDLYGETQKFRDHEFNAPRSDWLAAWRNWMRRAAEKPPLTGVASHGRR